MEKLQSNGAPSKINTLEEKNIFGIYHRSI